MQRSAAAGRATATREIGKPVSPDWREPCDMPTQEGNEPLTRIGPGIPMGDVLRFRRKGR